MIPQLLNAMKKQKRTFTINADDHLFYGDVTEAKRFGIRVQTQKTKVDREYEEGEKFEYEGKETRQLFVQYFKPTSTREMQRESIAFNFDSEKQSKDLADVFFGNFIDSDYLFITLEKESFLVYYHDIIGLSMNPKEHLTIHYKDHAEVYENVLNMDDIAVKMMEIEDKISGKSKEELTEGEPLTNEPIVIPSK